MKPWLAILAVVAVFLTGSVVGVLGTHLYYARILFGPEPPPGAGFRPPADGEHRPGPGFDMFARRLERELDLDPEQWEEIQRILGRNRHQTDELRRKLAPQVREMMERSRVEIEAVLNPEQRERFKELQERHRSHADRFFLRRPGKPPGAPPERPSP